MRKFIQVMQCDIKGCSAVRDFGWMCLFHILFISTVFSIANHFTKSGAIDFPRFERDEFIIYMSLSFLTTAYQVFLKKLALFEKEHVNLKKQ